MPTFILVVTLPVTWVLNAVWPGSGSAISSVIAASGTSAIGKAAIAYYIDDKTMVEVKKKFEEARKENAESSANYNNN